MRIDVANIFNANQREILQESRKIYAKLKTIPHKKVCYTAQNIFFVLDFLLSSNLFHSDSSLKLNDICVFEW